ncbi:hypothetical protein VSH64_44125 [Amycolatopsis rhabdoformis]|uniref:Integral membrane protein n=1 Tax=Amycolatopsis rhabdoformis TaxID=1448059 RepID=A0ABZ1I826_9PSEU|nr:hypothetical protein [Amycolatopsis rhabdoformis]WSE29708.1 hypothetical protein VSH64_44125 [Amycolatopsis rhabdoformis]
MIEALAFATTVVCVAGGFAVLGTGLAGRYRRGRTLPALAIVELALIGQAVADVLGLFGGDRPAELGTHLAYLATSLVLLPAAAVWSAGEEARWSAVVIAVALLAVAVVVVRAQTTWRPA